MTIIKTIIVLSSLLLLISINPIFAQNICQNNITACQPIKPEKNTLPPKNDTNTTTKLIKPKRLKPPPQTLIKGHPSPVGGVLFPAVRPQAPAPRVAPRGGSPKSARGGLKKPPKEGSRGKGGKKNKKKATKQKKGVSKKSTTGVDVALSSDTKIFSIPYFYSVSKNLSVGINLPFVNTSAGKGIGNTSLSARYYFEYNSYFAAQFSSTFLFPTSKEELGLSQTKDIQLGINGFYQIKRSRVFGSFTTILRGKDSTRSGDFFSQIIGFDTPFVFWSNNLNYYLAGQSYKTGEDFVDDVGQANQASYVDLIGGFVFLPLRMRLGLILPMATTSETIKNSEREIYLDLGWRHSF